MLYSLPKSSNRAAIGDLQSFKAVGKKKKFKKTFVLSLASKSLPFLQTLLCMIIFLSQGVTSHPLHIPGDKSCSLATIKFKNILVVTPEFL